MKGARKSLPDSVQAGRVYKRAAPNRYLSSAMGTYQKGSNGSNRMTNKQILREKDRETTRQLGGRHQSTE